MSFNYVLKGFLMHPPKIAAFLSFLREDQIRTDRESLQIYGRDWTTLFKPDPSAILFPETTEEVQKIILYAREHKLALVPSGGRTGLSGGSVAKNREYVVSLDRMNSIHGLDAVDMSISCEAGVVTEVLQEYASKRGFFFPLDFASKGSSQIGGNIATNAGGVKVIRYGQMRDLVLGLTVVTGEGQILNLNQSLVKNNAGIDLRHMFIGSEGILGIVTEVVLKLEKPPVDNRVLLLAVKDLSISVELLEIFRSALKLTAFEFFTANCLHHVVEHRKLKNPMKSAAPYYLLLEVEVETDEDEDCVLETFELCLEKEFVFDGVVSQSIAQSKNLWAYREGISEAISRFSPYKNDISVRLSMMPGFVADLEKILSREYSNLEVLLFGHIGDGNLHVNILRPADISPEDFNQRCLKVNRLVFELVGQYKGSVSAEHGVGLIKKDYLEFSRSKSEIQILKSIKNVFDPDGILNPGKVFDQDR